MVIYLLYFMPMQTKYLNLIEVFNELTCIVLMYHLQLFSDFVPSAETRSRLGISFIFFICLNVCVHIFFLMRSSFSNVRAKIQTKCCKKKR